MGKTVAYIVTAILLGMVAMLPVLVFTPKRADMADQSYYAIEGDMLKSDAERLQLQEEFGLARVPLNPFHLGLTIIVSFVFALSVSSYFKRKMF
jgi:hypothetical protein